MDTYDSSKNGIPKAANKSCLNICEDMLGRANSNWGSAAAGSTENELRAVVGCMLMWLRGQVRISLLIPPTGAVQRDSATEHNGQLSHFGLAVGLLCSH